MQIPPQDAPIKLPPATYDDWLKETKEIVAGPPQLRTRASNPRYLAFDSHRFLSDVLPAHYADNLFIVGKYSEFKGLSITATVKGYDYLLMGHITHSGPFTDCDEIPREHGQPHFHELDYYAPPQRGHPATKRRVTEDIYIDMPPSDFLDAFAEYYRFTPLGDQVTSVVQEQPVAKPKPVQFDLTSAFARGQSIKAEDDDQ